MKRILILVDYYLPGFKAGGPIASVSRIVERLSGEASFGIFTRDRDLGELTPFPDVRVNEWNDRDGVSIFYGDQDRVSVGGLRQAIKEFQPDLIYANSYFSSLTRAALRLRAAGRIKNIDIVIAPRGEFSPGALRLKSVKKSAFLRIANLLGLHRGLRWQASTEHEAEHIRHQIIGEPDIHIAAPEIRAAVPFDQVRPTEAKQTGQARFVFLSRVSPKKNLLRAIELLGELNGNVSLTVIGPIEDEAYGLRCRQAAKALGPNVAVHFVGAVPPEEVPAHLSQEQIFLFPTLGENFGHVIAEALAVGLPALLSDQTPWLDLEAHSAGWALPLDDEAAWKSCLQRCVDMNDETHRTMRRAALAYLATKIDSEDVAVRSRSLFGLECPKRAA